MKTFYIFKLNRSIYKIAKKTPYSIYLLLNSIYRHNKKDLSIAFNLFDEICLLINKEFFNKYFYEKLNNKEGYTKFKNIHMYHDYFTGEESKMTIYISHIKIKSNILNNVFFEFLTNDLFLCDFENEFYNYNFNNKKVEKI